jgi:hypothetical protein
MISPSLLMNTSSKCSSYSFFWVLTDQEQSPEEKLNFLFLFGERRWIQPKPNISADLRQSAKMGLESILESERHHSSLLQSVHELEALLFEDLSKRVGTADSIGWVWTVTAPLVDWRPLSLRISIRINVHSIHGVNLALNPFKTATEHSKSKRHGDLLQQKQDSRVCASPSSTLSASVQLYGVVADRSCR